MKWVAEQVGLRVILGPFVKDVASKPYVGWPCEPFSLPCLPEDLTELISIDDRHLAIRMHRARQRQLIVVIIYLQSGDPYLAALQGKRIIDRAASTGEDLLIIDDFNPAPDEAPAIPYTSSGMLFLADDAADTMPIRTRKDGCWIDYALHSLHVVPQARGLVKGLGDQDFVYYEFEFSRLEPCYARRSSVKVKIECNINNDEWDPAWTARQANLRTAVAARRSDAAWTLLSSAAETLALDVDAYLNRPKHSNIRLPERRQDARQSGSFGSAAVR